VPQPKKNDDFRRGHGHWCEDILRDFTECNPIPKSWGNTLNQRYNAALWLVRLVTDPEQLTTPERYLNGNSDLRNVIDHHVSFANYFSLAPDYFIALLAHVRTSKSAQVQLNCAMKILRELSHSDRSLGNKEIAHRVAVELGISTIDPSVIGKARSKLVKLDDADRAAKEKAYIEAHVAAGEYLREIKGTPKSESTST
jgi:hypothetical protein